MRRWCLGLVTSVGCAQLAGIENTSSREPIDDAPRLDARIDAAPPSDSKLPCAGGDARATDPMTGACYVLFTMPKTRNEARQVCAGLGAGTLLASVQTGTENQLITALLGQNSAFLGGTDEVTEGVFKWDDGTDVVLTNWYMGEPNNGTGLFEEDCIVIHGMYAGKWDDRPCAVGSGMVGGAYAFVCERD